MKKGKIYLACLLCCLGYAGAAQVWVPVTHSSGSRVINGRTVTVTSSGSVRTEATFAYCGAAPYTIGINYNGQPGSYTYSFSPATTTVRFQMSATNIGEINSFYINGAHYLLTAANLSPLNTCDPQFQLPLTVQGGDVIFQGPTVPGQSWYGQFGSGEVEINVPTGINTIEIRNNGIMGGTTFSFAYWGFYAEAANNNACRHDSLFLYGLPVPVTGVTYYWTGPNGFTSTDQNPAIPNADLVHEGIYTLRTTFANDTAYDTTLVKLREVPATPVITGDSMICMGGTARLNASSATPGVSYQWTGPGTYRANTAGTSIRNARERDTGTYTVVAVLNGCPSPPAVIPLRLLYPVKGDTLPVTVCAGGSYDFYGTQVSAAGIYEHVVPGGGSNGCDSTTYVALSVAMPTADTFSAAVCSGGSYAFNGRQLTEAGYYGDTVRTAAGCDSVIVVHLTVAPAARDTFAVTICRGESYDFNGRQLTGEGYFADTVRTAAGCDSTIVVHLTVNERPVITIAYDNTTLPCIGDTVLLQAQGADLYAWSLNGSRLGTGNPYSLTVPYQENYINVQGTDRNNCTDSAQLSIATVSCCELLVPNAFTPNGDGRNDRFRIQAQSPPVQYQIRIFNRWGKQVFAGGDINSSWDGNDNGTPADADVYYYHLTGKCLSGTEIERKGDVTLLR